LNPEQVAKMIDDMDKEINDIRTEALRLAWYMRGGLPYDQALQLSIEERKLISQIVKDNMETTKKSGLPFF
jgi:predicted component of type VI protein secretion system